MASAFNKFYSFVEQLAEKEHNLQSDALTLALTNSAPTSGVASLTGITQISYTGTSSSRVLTGKTSAQSNGLYKLIADDIIITGNLGTVGPFQYVVLYNATHSTTGVVGWWDYGSSITLQSGETLTVDFDATNGVLQIQ
jgi:hypothetical protein